MKSFPLEITRINAENFPVHVTVLLSDLNAAVLYLLFLPFLGGSLFVLRAVCSVCALLFFSQTIDLSS